MDEYYNTLVVNKQKQNGKKNRSFLEAGNNDDGALTNRGTTTLVAARSSRDCYNIAMVIMFSF